MIIDQNCVSSSSSGAASVIGGNNSSLSSQNLCLGSLSCSPLEKMADLDDLNRTLYDIGAQDLLDVWETMETEVRFSKIN